MMFMAGKGKNRPFALYDLWLLLCRSANMETDVNRLCNQENSSKLQLSLTLSCIGSNGLETAWCTINAEMFNP